MRYGTINCEFWVEEAVDIRRLCGNGIGNSLLTYLKTNQFTNMLGVYQITLQKICADVDLGDENVMRAFYILCNNGYIMYDKIYQYVWVVDLAYEQTFPGIDKIDYCTLALGALDNRSKSFNKLLKSLPSLSFLKKLIDKYQECLKFDKDLVGRMIAKLNDKNLDCSTPPSEGGTHTPSEGWVPLRSHETENRKQITGNRKQITETNIQAPPVTVSKSKKNSSSKRTYVSIDEQSEQFKELYNFWLNEMGDAVLCNIGKDNERVHSSYAVCEVDVQRAEEALGRYTIEECKQMIIGCKSTEYHMQNGHYSLFTIFRDITTRRTHLEKFKKISSRGGVKEQGLTLTQSNMIDMMRIAEELDNEQGK